MIDVPAGVTEEAVVIGEVSVADRVTRDNQIGHVSVSDRKDPPGHQQAEGLKAGSGEDGREGE